MFSVYGNWSKFMKQEVPPLLEQWPAISISDGIVSASPPGPTFIKDFATDKDFAIIDTSGTITSLDGHEAELLLTRNQFVYKKSAAETRIYDLSNVRSFSLDRQKLQRWLELAARYGPPALYVVVVLWSAVYRLALALILGAVGLWFAKRQEVRIRYPSAVRLSMMSLCPTIILATITDETSIDSRLDWVILLVVSLGFLWFGVGACRSEERAASTPGDMI